MYNSSQSCWLTSHKHTNWVIENNLPLSVQIMGKPCSDYSLIDFAESIEEMVEFNSSPNLLKENNES